MISLPNGCKRSNLTVFPANWKTKKAKLAQPWYISYRFYDPTFPKPKQVVIKGMNTFRELQERQDATQALLEDELLRLHHEGYNPITNISVIEPELAGEISEDTPLLEALEYARGKLTCKDRTKNEVRKAMVHIKMAIRQLYYSDLRICQVKRKHIRFILDKIGANKKGWTPTNFNHYRAYITMLFNELQEIEVSEIDLSRIKKQKEVAKKRQVLTMEERKKINQHLNCDKYYNFWRFVHIFFHSGARISELLNLKKEDVNLQEQKYKAIVYKGDQPRQVEKVIKTIALPLWVELVESAETGQYLFSKFLKPGWMKINEHQITKRWRIHVKQALGISADFYSLKYSNTTEISDALGSAEAARLNSHTSTAMVVKIYDTRHQERKNDQLKDISNAFA